LLAALLAISAPAFGGAPALVPPTQIIVVQDPPKVVPRVLEKAKPENTRITVSLSRQRACLLVDDEVAIDTPVSTGKRRGLTPAGEFTITAKSATRESNLHGDFIDAQGNILRSGVSTRIDSAPSGSTFRVVPVQYHMQLGDDGPALHAGRLPGYPAADTAVRLPVDIAPLIYQRVRTGTPVKIED
jgi:hypothetical protein